MRRALRGAGFGQVKVWLDSPPQNRVESSLLAAMRRIAFGLPPFRWFFEREVFAVAVSDGPPTAREYSEAEARTTAAR
jgi:hypothetical protein